VTCTV